ncbi:hypothetical protein ACHAXR_002749 [Thalassiosira sp. AJA248-18]
MNKQLHATSAAATPSSLAAALPSGEFNKIMSDPPDADGHKLAIATESTSSEVFSNTTGHNLTTGTKSSPQVNAKNADTSSPTNIGFNAVTSNNDVTQLLESFRSKNFAEKLHALLSVPTYQSILRWNPSGESFGIYDTDEFVTTVMATHFQRAKFDSFTRRMRRWGFRRMESMDEKLQGLVVYKSKLFLRAKPAMCKMMCDDRQWKNKERALPKVQRLVATADMPSASLAKMNGIKDHNEPMPVHFPTDHPEHSNWNPSINTMAFLPYPSSSPPLHQLSLTQHPRQPMAMNRSVEQAYPMGMMASSYPPQDTRNIPGMMAHNGMMPMMQNGTEAVMHHYHNNMMLPHLHHHQQQHSHHDVHPAMTMPRRFPGEQMMQRQYPNDHQGFNHNAEMALKLRLERMNQERNNFQP